MLRCRCVLDDSLDFAGLDVVIPLLVLLLVLVVICGVLGWWSWRLRQTIRAHQNKTSSTSTTPSPEANLEDWPPHQPTDNLNPTTTTSSSNNQ